MTVEFILLQIPLLSSKMERSPYNKEAVKVSKIQNVKLFIKRDILSNLLNKLGTNNNKHIENIAKQY